MSKADNLGATRPLLAAQTLSAGECAYLNPRDGWVYKAGSDHERCHGFVARSVVAGETVVLWCQNPGITDCPKLHVSGDMR